MNHDEHHKPDGPIIVQHFHTAVDPQVLAALSKLSQQMENIMATLADLQAAVAAEDTVIDSAITLIQGFSAQLAALQPNQAAIDALKADVDSKATALAAAVTTNTPAEPTV